MIPIGYLKNGGKELTKDVINPKCEQTFLLKLVYTCFMFRLFCQYISYLDDVKTSFNHTVLFYNSFDNDDSFDV